MTQELSSLIWYAFPLLNNFQFTYRLLAIICLVTAILAAIISLKLNKKIMIVFCLAAILLTILNWGHRRVIPEINYQVLMQNLPKSTAEGEANSQSAPKWLLDNPWFEDVPKSHIEIIDGVATIQSVERTNTFHSYVISAETQATLLENTAYFPGWVAYLNNVEIPMYYESENNPGLITLDIPEGIHLLEVKFIDTEVRTVGKIISLISISVLFAWLGIHKVLLLRFLPKF